MSNYNHKKIEKKWREKWEKDKIYQPNLDDAKNPFYNLMMFPYPSAEGLHVGNMYAFVHSDVYGRFMRLKGHDVFEPIGLDGFGIHSENYAIKIGEHIKEVSKRTEKNFYSQLHMIGNQFDWSRTVETYKPEYYRWTQWLFLKMYERGLAYRKKSPVNWCSSCKTVLSDEQVISGKCERCSTETEKRQMEQWFFKITDYVEKLHDNLAKIDWSEEVKTGQRNWIGKSEGAMVKFLIKDSDYYLDVFTTRPDTLFGSTYMVVCPEHSIIKNLKLKIKNWDEIQKYIDSARKKSELERTDMAKEKTGVKIEGISAINPVNNIELPIYIADYVLPDYGTGAIMAVPAHDERDWEFAKKYGLEIVEVIKGGEDVQKEAYIDGGVNVSSEFLDGLETDKAIKKMTSWLEEKKLGKKETNYRLRDWCVSRQRYWGPPIPMIECSKCGWVPVPEKDLPVLLPEMDDFLPDGSGKGPLNKIKDFVNTVCPKCGGEAKRETDVSDPFVDSSWYYLRYPCTDFDDKPFDKPRTKKWMPVDMYIGGREHTVLHLLYSRFVTMVMHELGYVPEEEPFKKFRAHGLLIREGAKISKSKGNIVNPDEYIEKFGADTVRLYLLFLGDMRQGGDWRDSGIMGAYRFVNKVYKLKSKIESSNIKSNLKLEKLLHKTIKKVTEDLENLKFNTAISQLMILTNAMEKENELSPASYQLLVILLAPLAPHVTEELWHELGNKDSIHLQKWPKYDKDKIKEDTIELVVQINGKFRSRLKAPLGIEQKQAEEMALSDQKIKKYLDGKKIKRTIFVKDKLINIVLDK